LRDELSSVPKDLLLRFEQAPRPLNWASAINRGAAASRGEHLLVMHDDVRPLEPSWLEAMLELSEQRGIGAVGAKLYYPHGALQHIGLILGVDGVAARPFDGHSPHATGYYSAANCIRNYSAVGGACLLSRREVFDAVGGMNDTLSSYGWDIDYCLRVGDAGYRVVYTPYAQLTHNESGCVPSDAAAGHDREWLRARWGSRLQRDPFYNPNLSREHLDYRVALTADSP
jgi:GT2 family glycosyltransferase